MKDSTLKFAAEIASECGRSPTDSGTARLAAAIEGAPAKYTRSGQHAERDGETFFACYNVEDAEVAVAELNRLLAANAVLVEAAKKALSQMELAWSDSDGGGPMFHRDDFDYLRVALAKEQP